MLNSTNPWRGLLVLALFVAALSQVDCRGVPQSEDANKLVMTLKDNEANATCKLGKSLESKSCPLSSAGMKELDAVVLNPFEAIGKVFRTPLLCRLVEKSLADRHDQTPADGGGLLPPQSIQRLLCSWDEGLSDGILSFNESAYVVTVNDTDVARRLGELAQGTNQGIARCKWIHMPCAVLKVHGVEKEDALGAPGQPIVVKQRPVFLLSLPEDSEQDK